MKGNSPLEDVSGAEAQQAPPDDPALAGDGSPVTDRPDAAGDQPPFALPSTPRAIITRLSDVQPKDVRWLWDGRIPLGKQTSLIGDPGLGKSFITLDIAARISTGRAMPDGSHGALYQRPSGVLILSAEDDPEDTIRPRSDALGADPNLLVVLSGVEEPTTGERMPNLADLAPIADAVERVHAGLVIVDPLMAYLPSRLNAYKDQHMRQVLAPLCKLAAVKDFALLVVVHLTKPGETAEHAKAIYRSGGSIGIAGNARSVLLAARDKTDSDGERCVLASVKCNLAARPASLAYSIEPHGNGFIVAWGGEVDADADDLVRPASGDRKNADAGDRVEEAIAFLTAVLANGPVASQAVLSEARAAGISEKTLRRAKKTLSIVSAKNGQGGPWSWFSPTSTATE